MSPEVQTMAGAGDSAAQATHDDAPRAPDPAPAGRSGRARTGRWLGAIVIAAAVAAAAAFALTAGVPDAEVVAHVAGAQELGPERSLAASGAPVAGIPTPDLGALGWTPTGARADTVGTHSVATAVFRRGGRTVAASVVSGPPVRLPGRTVAAAGAVRVHEISLAGRLILSWGLADGRTVVLSSVAVPGPRLVALARALAARGTGG